MNKQLLSSAIVASLLGTSLAADATTVSFTPMDQVTVNTRSSTSQAIFVSNRSMAISNTGDVLTQNEALEIVAIHDGQLSVLDTCATGDEVFNKIMLSGDNKIAYWRCDSRVRGATKVDGQYVGKTVTVGGGAYPLDYDFAISAKNGRAFNLDKATGGSLQGRSRVGVYNEETERFSQVVLPEEFNSYMVRSFSADGSHALIQYGSNNPKLIDLDTFETTPYQEGETEFAFNSYNVMIANDEDQAVGAVGSCYWFCNTSAILWDEPSSTGTYLIESNGFEGVSVQDASSDLSTVLTWANNEEPQLWNSWTGELRGFEAFMLQYGANLQGWSDLQPVAISENGLFITGMGTNSAGEPNKAFIVEINPAAECTYTY